MLVPTHEEDRVSGTEVTERSNRARRQETVPALKDPDQDPSKQHEQWPLLAGLPGECDDVLSGCDEEEEPRRRNDRDIAIAGLLSTLDILNGSQWRPPPSDLEERPAKAGGLSSSITWAACRPCLRHPPLGSENHREA